MSWINHELRSIFVHVPKCAGRSMAALPWNPAANHDSIYTLCTKTRGRLATGQLACAFDHASYFKWTFVRNPWDRLVSAYEFASDLYLSRRTGDRFGDRQPCPFDVFVEYLWANRRFFDGRINFQMGDVWRYRSFKLNGMDRVTMVPQHLFLEMEGKLAMDFIGRFENIYEDFQYVCDRLGQQNRLPHLNRTVHRPYQEYYTPDTRDMVAEVYARDIEVFGYRFDCNNRADGDGLDGDVSPRRRIMATGAGHAVSA